MPTLLRMRSDAEHATFREPMRRMFGERSR